MRMGIDIHEVIDAAKTKPFGFQAFYPGPGLGGHCIPIDPYYLSWKAREFDFRTRFIELAGELNARMPYFVVDQVSTGLNEQSKCLKGAKILVLGLAYKRDIDDLRESPSLTIIELLRSRGAEVCLLYTSQVLVGVGHASGTLVNGPDTNVGNAGAAFASIMGGGVDWRLKGRWSIRLAEADYLLTDVYKRQGRVL